MPSTLETSGFKMAERAINISAVTEAQTASANATKALINQLIFAESKSVRTSTIILACFNVFAAVVTVGAILYDCYVASKRASLYHKARKFCVSSIHPAETFPLVLGIGIAIQGIVFATAQAAGLKSIYVEGCEVIGQFVFPAIFLVPYIQLIFGLECTIRSFRTLPFQARGKFDVSICCAIVTVMVVGTWIPSHISPEKDLCFASLLWFVTRYGVEGLVLLAGVAGLSTILAVIIFYRLSTGSMIDQHQRIAASRMVYYLVLAVVPLAFIVPWFITLTLDSPDLTTSMMATVVLNLSGILNGALYMFLRSNTVAASFRPKDLTSWQKNQHEIRLWGPNELGFTDHLLVPVTGPRSDSHMGYNLEKVLSDESLISMFSPDPRDRILIEAPNPNRNASPTSGPTSRTNDIALARSASKRHVKNPSYSLFPAEGPTSPNIQAGLVASPPRPVLGDGLESIYIAADLQAPPKIAFNDGPRVRHARNPSIESTATVQIGLRFSGALLDRVVPLPATQYNPSALPSTTYQPFSDSTSTVERRVNNTLQVQTQNLSPKPPPRSPYRPSPLNGVTTVPNEEANTNGLLSASLFRDTRMKTLPPVPRRQSRMASLQGEPSPIQLSPTVYSLSPTVYTPVERPSPSHSPSTKPELIRSAITTRPPGLPSSPRRPTAPSRSQRAPGRSQPGTPDGLTRNSRGEWM